MTGLSTAQAASLLAQHGPNKLPQPRQPWVLVLFIRQLQTPLVYVLMAAGVLALLLRHWSDAIFIGLVLVIDALIGTVQEYGAQRAAQALNRMVPQWCKVCRDGHLHTLDATNLVPGDEVHLASGDRIPADMQLTHAHNAQVDESAMTGESVAVAKTSGQTLYAGTLLTTGRAVGVVSATGAGTALGKIAQAVKATVQPKSPLTLRLEQFTLKLTLAMGLVVALFAVVYLLQGKGWAEVLMVAVALAVAAVPEGLPASITIAMAVGMRRMAASHVIVRRLVALEALGSCTMIATDKTGTLSLNEQTVVKLTLADGATLDVTETLAPTPDFLRLVEAGIYANEGAYTQVEHKWVGTGDQVDVAFLALGQKAGLGRPALLTVAPQVSHIPYESERGFSASTHQLGRKKRVYAKGALERLLPHCKTMLTAAGEKPLKAAAVKQLANQLAGQGFRVLALAEGKAAAHDDTLPDSMTLLGLAALIDPLRPEAKPAIAACKAAGIRVAMITGDHPHTAANLALELGLIQPGEAAITGHDLDTGDLDTLVRDHHVFARVSPYHKQQIVHALMRQGHFVAVTGDGVNDAPALHQAHVGVAMGLRGTDVARESADLILTDDNFASLVAGIREGRVVYNNVRKVVFLLVSTGLAELLMFLLALVLGTPVPLLAAQLIWLNLVTTGLQDVVLALEPAEGNELAHHPRPPSQPIFNGLMLERLFLSALTMAGGSMAVFMWCLHTGMDEASARNITLLAMVLFSNFHVLNGRSEQRSVFAQSWLGNPGLFATIVVTDLAHIGAMYWPVTQKFLGTAPVSALTWAWLVPVALSVIGVNELHKLYSHLRRLKYKSRPKATSSISSKASG